MSKKEKSENKLKIQIEKLLNSTQKKTEEEVYDDIFNAMPQWFDIEELIQFVDNNDLKPSRIQKILNDFNKGLFEPIIVDKYPDGDLVIEEGHTRVVVASAYGMTKIRGYLREVSAVEETASYYRLWGKSKPNKVAYDDFKAALRENSQFEVIINDIIISNGFKVCKNPGEWTISNIGTILPIVRDYGKDLLNMELEIISKAYNGLSTSTKSSIIKSLAHFLNENIGKKNFDKEILIHALAANRPINLESKLRTKNSREEILSLYRNEYNRFVKDQKNKLR